MDSSSLEQAANDLDFLTKRLGGLLRLGPELRELSSLLNAKAEAEQSIKSSQAVNQALVVNRDALQKDIQALQTKHQDTMAAQLAEYKQAAQDHKQALQHDAEQYRASAQADFLRLQSTATEQLNQISVNESKLRELQSQIQTAEGRLQSAKQALLKLKGSL